MTQSSIILRQISSFSYFVLSIIKGPQIRYFPLFPLYYQRFHHRQWFSTQSVQTDLKLDFPTSENPWKRVFGRLQISMFSWPWKSWTTLQVLLSLREPNLGKQTKRHTHTNFFSLDPLYIRGNFLRCSLKKDRLTSKIDSMRQNFLINVQQKQEKEERDQSMNKNL